MLARAEHGDLLSARDALELLAFVLSPENRNPATGEPLPVPLSARAYLSRSFSRMARGVAPSDALNLVGRGPRKWRHQDKRLAASIAWQFIDQGMTVDEACREAADAINLHTTGNLLAAENPRPAWIAFAGKTISPETLLSWYYELKNAHVHE